jgi:DNA-binding NarL/FixJ family response regulator
VIRLLIAAPSAVVRAGLEALAASNPEWQVVGSFPDLSGIEDLQPDVVLAALPLEEIPPLPAHRVYPLVLLTSEGQPAWTLDALRHGVRAVEAATNSLAVLDPQDLDALLSAAAPAQYAGLTSALTVRELEVLRMLAEGAANKVIAWKLGISEHTVKFHVASILSKLNASSRTEAVTIGIRNGLVLL